MALMRFKFRSEILGDTSVTVVIPTNNQTIFGEKIGQAPAGFPQSAKFEYKPGMKYQTIWFLHGGGDDDLTSYRLTSLERYAEDNQVMLVTPLAHDTMYNNTTTGVRYIDYITKELPLVIRTLFPAAPEPENNFIMGSAMGGNGALGLAMMFPELYTAVVDLSGGIGLTLDREVYRDQMSWMGGRMKNFFRGEDEFENTEHDLYYLAKKNVDEGKKLPQVFIGVGENDFIEYRVKKDYERLKELGYPVCYEEGKGLGHEWDFWDLYFRKAIYEWLPLRREPIYPEA